MSATKGGVMRRDALPREIQREREDASRSVDDEEEADREVALAETSRTCPECEAGPVVKQSASGEWVCEACGLVVEVDQLDRGAEWRAFSQEEWEAKSRVGAPMTETIHDKGLTTQIDWRDRDASGRQLSGEKRAQLHRLRKWQERIRTKDAGERNLQQALGEIARMTATLGVPESAQEVASVIYRRALDADLLRGRSIEGVASACLYAGCREDGVPRSLDEVSQVARVDQLEIGRAYRYVSRELGLELAPTDPAAFVPRFCSDLDLGPAVEAKAREVIETAAEAGLVSGRSPTSVAAGAVYGAALLCNDSRTQWEVAAVPEVTQVTIRNRYQEQLGAMGVPT